MTPEEVHARLQGRVFMTLAQAHLLRGLIQFFDLKQLLELGHMHGASTCQLAAAACLTHGHVTTVDCAHYDPSVESNLARCGLRNVTIHVETPSAGGEWRLLQFLEEGRAEAFDFIYIDARHLWTPCAADFIIAERLLRPGGWLLFDDLLLDHTRYPADTPWIKTMSLDERTTAQVGKVWSHLVLPHPALHNHVVHGNWGFCQKRP